MAYCISSLYTESTHIFDYNIISVKSIMHTVLCLSQRFAGRKWTRYHVIRFSAEVPAAYSIYLYHSPLQNPICCEAETINLLSSISFFRRPFPVLIPVMAINLRITHHSEGVSIRLREHTLYCTTDGEVNF